jgi:hypothetical protein
MLQARMSIALQGLAKPALSGLGSLGLSETQGGALGYPSAAFQAWSACNALRTGARSVDWSFSGQGLVSRRPWGESRFWRHIS